MYTCTLPLGSDCEYDLSTALLKLFLVLFLPLHTKQLYILINYMSIAYKSTTEINCRV